MLTKYQFKRCGKNVKYFSYTKIISPENISIGNNVLIDDFVFIGNHQRINISDYVHIAAFAFIGGGGELDIGDFCSIGIHTIILTGSDDFVGEGLINPTIPEEFRKVSRSFVTLEKHATLTTNITVLPGVTIGEGAVVGANSLVTKDIPPWTICVGSPAKPIKDRNKDNVLRLEAMLREKELTK